MGQLASLASNPLVSVPILELAAKWVKIQSSHHAEEQTDWNENSRLFYSCSYFGLLTCETVMTL